MTKPKSGGGNKTTPVKPSRTDTAASSSRTLSESTSPINKGGKVNEATTSSTGPKGPAKKK